MERKVNYTKEFKIQACELVVKNGLKVKAVADKMGISHIMLYRWIDQYKTFGKDAFVGKGNLRPEEAKLKKLQKTWNLLKILRFFMQKINFKLF